MTQDEKDLSRLFASIIGDNIGVCPACLKGQMIPSSLVPHSATCSHCRLQVVVQTYMGNQEVKIGIMKITDESGNTEDVTLQRKRRPKSDKRKTKAGSSRRETRKPTGNLRLSSTKDKRSANKNKKMDSRLSVEKPSRRKVNKGTNRRNTR